MPHLPPSAPIRGPRIPRDALKRIIEELTVTDWAPTGWSVIWSTEQEPFEGLRNDTLGAWVELGISAYRSIGQDDYRQAFDEATGVLTSVYYGLRAFTLTIDVRSFDADVPAWDILESIRLRLNNARSVGANTLLHAANLAVARLHPTVSLNYVDRGAIDNRMIWRQTMDVEFTWLSAAQTTDDAGGTIETVGTVPTDSPPGTNDVAGIVDNPDGNPWPNP